MRLRGSRWGYRTATRTTASANSNSNEEAEDIVDDFANSDSGTARTNTKTSDAYYVALLEDEIKRIEDRQNKIATAAYKLNHGGYFNLNSAPQVSEVLFGTRNNPTGKKVLEEVVLENNNETQTEIARLVLRHKKYETKRKYLGKQKDDGKTTLKYWIRRKEDLLEDKTKVRSIVGENLTDHFLVPLLEGKKDLRAAAQHFINSHPSPSDHEKDKTETAQAAKEDESWEDNGKEVETPLPATEFVTLLIQAMPNDQWENSDIVFKIPDSNRPFMLQGDEFSKEEMLQKSQEVISENKDISSVAVYGPKKKIYTPEEFSKRRIAIDWDPATTKGILGSFLQGTTDDILAQGEVNIDGVPIANRSLSFVTVEPSLGKAKSYFFDLRDTAFDKRYAVVIAGESGSGKSVFSCLVPKAADFDVFYCAMENDDLQNKNYGDEDYPLWNAYIGFIFDYLLRDTHGVRQDKEDSFLERLDDAKQRLSTKRNLWAMEVAKRVMERVTTNHDIAKNWVAKNLNASEVPDRVAIVLDEATDIDFARGMVANVRDFLRDYRCLAAQQVCLVLAGTGLDSLSEDAQGVNSLGTNPSKSRVVICRQPDIKAIGNHPAYKAAIAAAMEGVLSRVMSTNARILFRGVLPILMLNVHKLDLLQLEDDERAHRLHERLKAIGGYPQMMDYGYRMYFRLNSAAELMERRRQTLGEESFIYHTIRAVCTLLWNKKAGDTMRSCLEKELSFIFDLKAAHRLYGSLPPQSLQAVENPVREENIFTRGFAGRRKTSPALKLLACCGRAVLLPESFGGAFEELTAQHMHSLAELQGYTKITRFQLNHGWPQKANDSSSKLKPELIKELGEKWEQDQEDDAERLCKAIGHVEDRKICIICFQGSSVAQGADVLVLMVDGNQAHLDAIQCKHYKDFPSQEKSSTWWHSLGIDCSTKQTSYCNMHPEGGSAGYSYKALEVFARLLESKLVGIDVTIRFRILASSLSATKLNQLFVPRDKNVRVWCREVLEPTISAVPRKDGI